MGGRKSVKSSPKSASDSLSELLYKEFASAIDAKALTTAYHQQFYGDRLYDYQRIVREVGMKCLRSYCGEVYYFEGRIWKSISRDQYSCMEYALRDVLVNCGVGKNDVVKSSPKLVGCLRDGASVAPLGVNPGLVGFRNGVWDFSNIDCPVRYEFSDRMPVLQLLDYDYDPEATCPNWLSFLHSILPDGQILTLQKYLGLGCVCRRSMTHRVEESLWLIGSGGNGKTTITNVITGVLGAWNVGVESLSSLVSGNPDVRARILAGVVGKTFNICDEVQAYDITRYEDAFKSLCSGSPQTIRRIGGDFETAYDIPFIIFSMNRKPTNANLDKAMLRRLIFIPFKAKVTDQDMKRDLDTVLKKEYSGIRNWLIQGYRRLVESEYKFTKSDMTEEEKRSYMVENHQTIRLFMDENGIRESYHINNLTEKPMCVLANVLYQEYVRWCEGRGYDHEEFNGFSRTMTLFGVEKSRSNVGMVYSLFCDKKLDYFFNK